MRRRRRGRQAGMPVCACVCAKAKSLKHAEAWREDSPSQAGQGSVRVWMKEFTHRQQVFAGGCSIAGVCSHARSSPCPEVSFLQKYRWQA